MRDPNERANPWHDEKHRDAGYGDIEQALGHTIQRALEWLPPEVDEVQAVNLRTPSPRSEAGFQVIPEDEPRSLALREIQRAH